MQVLAHVAVCLRDMHGAGFVHCDIKPSNIMLLAAGNRWTIADLSTAAAIGSQVSTAGGNAWTAPEVVVAAAHNALTIPAAPAMDAWALGLVAFQLLTGQQAMCPDDPELVCTSTRMHALSRPCFHTPRFTYPCKVSLVQDVCVCVCGQPLQETDQHEQGVRPGTTACEGNTCVLRQP